MKKIIFLFILLFTFSSFLQEKFNKDVNQQLIDEKLVLVFAGDVMGHVPQHQAAYNSKTKQYNFESCFEHVKSYIAEADYAFVNLEVTLAGRPYTGYPNFSSPDALLDATKYAGFDAILTANNHVADRGKAGLERTIKTIINRKLPFAGSYLSKEQRDSVYPIIIQRKGLKIAILNATYGTNMNPVYNPNVVNMLDSTEILSDINTAKRHKVDLIIAVLHWGTEYELVANQQQKDFANFLKENGVNMIIGSHPHVVQNAEYLDSTVPVVYSLGNFISNQRKINTNGGILLKVEISKIAKQISSISYLPVYVHRGNLNGKYQYHLIPCIDFIKSPSKFKIPTADSTSLVVFDTETRKRLNNLSLWDNVFTK